MIRSIKKDDIPEKNIKTGRSKSSWRIHAENDILGFIESDDEAVEFIDSVSADNIERRQGVLRAAVKDLGIKGVKVIRRGNRLFVVKEDNFE